MLGDISKAEHIYLAVGYKNIVCVVNAYCWAHARRKFYEALPANMKDVFDTLAYTGLKKQLSCLQ